MKLNGQKPLPPQNERVVLPRINSKGDPEDIVFICAPVVDFSVFEELYPEPTPPLKMVPGGGQEQLIKDPVYVSKRRAYSEKRTNWMILKSLEATPGLEWESVEMSDPSTYENYEEELSEFLTPHETNLVIQGVMDANVPNEKRQKEAMERFMSIQEGKESDLSSPKVEQDSTLSGELVND